MDQCSIKACTNKYFAAGYCQTHYTRIRKYGDPDYVKPKGQPKQHAGRLFWLKVDPEPYGEHGCWRWLGSHDHKGYSMFPTGRRRPEEMGTDRAHIITYQWFVGPVPEGKELDHVICDDKGCINPFHLKITTPKENGLRSRSAAAVNSRKTHCKWGHPFDKENTIWIGNSRVCRICKNARAQKNRPKEPNLSAKSVRKLGNLRSVPLAERIHRMILKDEDPDKCWVWLGTLTDKGYPVFGGGRGKQRLSIHRWIHEQEIGPIPIGLDVDHLCDNRCCCNPKHLEAKTRKRNVLRGRGITAQLARRTHCNHGHEFSKANIYIDSYGYRRCRECRRSRSRIIEAKAAKARGSGIPNGEKTHCPKGHEYTEENTQRSKEGDRHCRQCALDKRARRSKELGLQPANGLKTHCKRGHEYTPENTIIKIKNGAERRGCRTCHNERRNDRYQSKKLAIV